jgi:SAM-dependent methyltransferase
MTGWSDGYASEIEYIPGFYKDQSPAHLDLVCLICGIVPPDRGEDFVYCELGCGVGVTILLLAAANPSARFVGIDFNPAHIARGRVLAKEAGLTNVELIEASFADLTGPNAMKLPEFDYVTLHGVYSWVSQENRRAIIRFLDARLKPGGLAYVTYNAMPNWIAGLPLQRLLSEFAGLHSDSREVVMVQAIRFLRAMREAGARAFADPELVERLEKLVEQGSEAYLVHEYLNDHWQPLYHADVARDFAEAKLNYVGTATLLENFPDLCLTPDQRKLLDPIGVAPVRETFKDYFVSRSFRRDVFVRGARRLSVSYKEELLREVRLGLSVARDAVRHQIEVPAGEAKLEEPLYGPVFDALLGGNLTVGELLSLPAIAGKYNVSAVELVGMLVGSGQALPVPARHPGVGAVAAFNRVVAAEAARESKTSTPLAAAAAQSGIHITLFELLAFRARTAGVPAELEALAKAAWRDLSQRGEFLRKNGEPIESEAETMAILREEIGKVLTSSLPRWRNLGVL